MRIPRFYISSDISIQQTIKLPDEAGQHLSRVLRMKCDQQVTLFNGQGGEFLATIVDIQRHRVTVSIESFSNQDCESPLDLTLIQCISRGDRMDYTIQKAVELGVNTIQPVFSQRGMVKLDEKRAARKVEHWQKVAISACEQSGRNKVPSVLNPIKIIEALTLQINTKDLKLLMHTSDGSAQPYTLSSANHGLRSCVLLAGPEGGLTTEEVSLAQQQDFQLIQLGPRILRTETAAIALISILQSRLGDMC